MHNKSTHVANPDDGYEISDVKVKVILIAGVFMVALTLVSFAMSFMYGKMLNSDTRGSISDYEQSELAEPHNEWKSEVRLQSNPGAEMAAHRKAQHDVSLAWGTVSESPEIYRIPIDQALDHVAKHGLPVWQPTETAAE